MVNRLLVAFSPFAKHAALTLLFVAVMFAASTGQKARAQNGGEAAEIASILAESGEAYGRAYTEPFIDAATTGLAGGLFSERARGIDLFGAVNLYVGVTASYVPTSESERTFSLEDRRYESQIAIDGQAFPVSVEYRGVTNVPTALGGSPADLQQITIAVACSGPEDGPCEQALEERGREIALDAPQGLLDGLSFMPTAAPQVGLGIPAIGLRVSSRFTPNLVYEGVGEGMLYGFGARQSLIRLIPGARSAASSIPMFFDASIWGYYQHVTLSEDLTGQNFLSYNHYSGGIYFSRAFAQAKWGDVAGHLGLGAQRGVGNFYYEARSEAGGYSSTADFSVESGWDFRGRVGIEARLGVLVLGVEYGPFPRSFVNGSLGLAL